MTTSATVMMLATWSVALYFAAATFVAVVRGQKAPPEDQLPP